MTEQFNRKKNRLSTYDYSEIGFYFITICTEDKRCVLGHIAESEEQPHVELSRWGTAVDAAIRGIPSHYPYVTLDKYVIMPNHIHLILWLKEENRASVSHIIQQMKGAVTKQLGVSIWQKSFHDHVIRGDEDYREIWQYIENNPLKWTLDRYYCE